MAANSVNRQWLLANRPAGWPRDSDFKLAEAPVPEPGPGELLARVLWLSVDPYMRGRMRDVKSYAPPVPLGGVMEGGTVAKVVASKHPKFKVGDVVEGRLGWQDYALSDGKGVRVIDPALAPISTALGVLGMPGLTAYFGLLEICRPQRGETVLVSGAAGAVGSLVGQIARIQGARAVGIAGTEAAGSIPFLPGGMDLAGVDNQLLHDSLSNGNAGVYDDLYWQHLAMQQGGIETIRAAAEAGEIPQEQLAGWETVAAGRAALDEARDHGVHLGNVLGGARVVRGRQDVVHLGEAQAEAHVRAAAEGHEQVRVAAMLLPVRLLRRAPRWIQLVPPYAIGALAVAWTLERVSAFWS